MNRQFSSFSGTQGLQGRGLPQLPRNQSRNHSRHNYVNHHLPHLDNSLLAANHYWTTLGHFDQHVKIHLTRYHDFYSEKGLFPQAAAISSSAISELAEQLAQHQLPYPAALRRAEAMILCDNYARCEVPESIAAWDSLRGWAQYLHAHLNIKNLPDPGQQEYQRNLAAQAESTAATLWQAHREFHRDPMKWGNEWAWQEKQRVQQQLEIAGNAAHQIWKHQHCPELIEPATPIPKLRPEACEFVPSESLTRYRKPGNLLVDGRTPIDSGYASPSGSDEQQDPLSKATARAPEKSPKFVSPEDFANEDLATVQEGLDSLTVRTACEETLSKSEGSQHETHITSLSTPVVPRSKSPTGRTPSGIKQCFNHTILLFSELDKKVPVMALFDSGAKGPNWVSREVVETLGKGVAIFALEDETPFVAADGQQLRALGSIELAWNFPNPKDGHFKWRHETFNVLPSDHIQVIFGADYCRQNDYLHFNEHAIHASEVTPLMPSGKPSDGPFFEAVKQKMANEKKQRDENRRAAEAQRIEAEKRFEAASAARRGNQSGKKRE